MSKSASSHSTVSSTVALGLDVAVPDSGKSISTITYVSVEYMSIG